MKQAVAVAFLTLAPIAALVFRLTSASDSASDARAALNQHVAHKGDPLRALQFVRAGRPWNFSQAMSARVIGDSARYRTDDDFSGNLRRERARFESQQAYTNMPAGAQDQRMPVPYPPEEV